ncbi:MAG TPA: hypothetical protein VMD98_00570 [Bryocella sp.]|nr:hypothetical protein [Bryocella sp.]
MTKNKKGPRRTSGTSPRKEAGKTMVPQRGTKKSNSAATKDAGPARGRKTAKPSDTIQPAGKEAERPSGTTGGNGKPRINLRTASPEETLAWLKECGAILNHPPIDGESTGRGEHARPALTIREHMLYMLLKIRGKDGRLRNLLLNRAQLELERCSGNRNIVLKARQLGVTTYVAARFFLNTIAREGTLSVQVAHDQRSAEEIFRIVHRFLDNLPESLRKGALVTSRANVRQIVFPMLDSEYRVETAADPNAGRGLTIHNLHCSEVARWPRDVAETLASLRAAVPPGGEIFLESTPNGAGGTFYEEWLRAPQTGYTRHFFPWWWDPTYRRPSPLRGGKRGGDVRPVEILNFTEEELELMQKHGLDAGQIAFRREMRENFRIRAREEFAEDPESCFLASGECVFDAEKIEERLRQCPQITSEMDHGRFITFFPPVAAVNGACAKSYIVGVDPAGGGIDGDYSCAQVIDANSGVQCAELHGHFRPEELAARVAKLARDYNDALIAVERNNHGYSVLAHLTMGQGYTNLYVADGQAGWPTNVATRPRMLANLAELLASASFLFLSPRLLEECRTFVRHEDGSCSAASGTHDDTVMAMAIAQAVRAEVVVKGPRSAAEARLAVTAAA